MTDEPGKRGGSLDESMVVHEVWAEVGGELVEEYPVPTAQGDGRRDRRLDGLMVTDSHRYWHDRGHVLPLRDREVVVCQAKAGELDLGVLGQTIFGGQLIQDTYKPKTLRLIAAAVKPNPFIERLLQSYCPQGQTLEYRVYPHLKSGRSSGHKDPVEQRLEYISALHCDYGGLLIANMDQRGRKDTDFARVRAAATGEPLSPAAPQAIILPSRPRGTELATTAVDVQADEPVILVYTSYSLYMTPMGCAVFGSELARRLLGLNDVTSCLCYRADNPALRAMIAQFPSIRLIHRP